MPARKTPANWRARTVALLRCAAERGGVRSAAFNLGEKRPQLIDEAIAISEATHVELMGEGRMNNVSYNEACRVAADRLEAA